MKNNREIPGMLYILVSFIPWIVYWILCSMGSRLGVTLAFVTSLILIIPQIRKKDFNIMDVTSILYFSIATIGTFIFNLDTFIKNSGFIGYSVLFLMALFSLIIKQPYTFQVSKKDYPEIYWKDKSFLAINNMITAVWAAIFMTNATVFLLLKEPLTIIISNVLVVFGVIFSVAFPPKVLSYFALREFKKLDWDAKVNPQKPKRGK